MAKCEHCDYVGLSKGDGKCRECHGTGWRGDFSVIFDTFSSKENQKCKECHGSGKCPYCGGKGYVTDPFFGPTESKKSKRESSSRRERQEYQEDEFESEPRDSEPSQMTADEYMYIHKIGKYAGRKEERPYVPLPG